MTGERQDQASPEPVRRPASGISIDPARLAWYREARPWSRRELSAVVARLRLKDETGAPLTVSGDAIAKIENGERRPKARTVRALCAALGISVRDLMPGAGELPPHPEAEERRLRLARNADLRQFAGENGIRYLSRDSGRVYYSVPLQAAFDAAVAGEPDDVVAGLIAVARAEGCTAEDPGEDAPEPGQEQEPGSIAALDLSPRVHNALISAGVRTTGALREMTAGELLALRGIGAAALAEIREKTAGGEDGPEHAVPDPRLALGIGNLNLVTRTQNMLLREGIATIGELTEKTAGDLLEIRNLGPGGVRDVRARLREHGLSLRGDPAPRQGRLAS